MRAVVPVCEHTFVSTSQLPTSYLDAVRALKESLMRLVRELDPESVPMEEVIEMLIEIAEFEHAIASVSLGERGRHASADA